MCVMNVILSPHADMAIINIQLCLSLSAAQAMGPRPTAAAASAPPVRGVPQYKYTPSVRSPQQHMNTQPQVTMQQVRLHSTFILSCLKDVLLSLLYSFTLVYSLLCMCKDRNRWRPPCSPLLCHRNRSRCWVKIDGIKISCFWLGVPSTRVAWYTLLGQYRDIKGLKYLKKDWKDLENYQFNIIISVY